MALSPELEAEGLARIGLDDFGALTLDDFGELPLGDPLPSTPWHIVTSSGTISGQTFGEWQIKTVYGEQN